MYQILKMISSSKINTNSICGSPTVNKSQTKNNMVKIKTTGMQF